jgi:hypothetical protein
MSRFEKKLVDSAIEHYLFAAERVASKTVEKLARKILCENVDLDEFVMAMGTWSFTIKHKKPSEDADDNEKRFDEIREFISKWDKKLKITGEAMRFTADGEKITNW